MKNILMFLSVIIYSMNHYSQVMNNDTITNAPLNSAQNIISGNGGKQITIGAYAEIDYNQKYNDSTLSNGNLDVHRMVMFMGYKFNDRTHFVTEIEFEHISEVYIEQAFLNYRINQAFNIRGGLMLIPMGIINEYHEPVTFNGVERPNLDGKIIPTTWRELGFGFTGTLNKYSIKYQAYVVNGFKSYENGATLRGVDGFRKGRQKGMESTMSSPNFTGKIDYYGINGLKIGLSLYYGNTQSKAYDGVLRSDDVAISVADSTVLGLGMVGADLRYNNKGFEARGQFVYSSISNSQQYNIYNDTDLGSSMMGYYAEIGYDVIRLFKKNAEQKFVLFTRYEFYDTHNTVSSEIVKNKSFARTDITSGFSYHLSRGTVFKGDFQLFKTNANSNIGKQFNLGLGVWF